ncbi:MAG TPA: hypothetical protein DC056_12955, partial [Dehalococcoidia bacterium]|nr:hypothetical protein [Dehalococcoidia bacterium]
YFAQYLVTELDIELRTTRVDQLQVELDEGLEKIELEMMAEIEKLQNQLAELGEPPEDSEESEDSEDGEEKTPDPRVELQTEIAKLQAQLD